MRTTDAPNLTPRRIESLKPKARPYRVADGGAPVPGLLLVIHPSGRRSWLSRLTVAGGYHLDDEAPRRRQGRRVDLTLGAWPALSIEEARERHRQAAALAADGHDPRHDRVRGKVAPRMGELRELWLAHLEKHKGLAPRTIQAHRRRWEMYLSRLDGLKVAELDRQDVAPELTRAADKAPTQAHACLKTLRAAMGWAIAQGWIDTDPTTGMKADAYGAATSKPRDVVLTLEELRRVWASVAASRMGKATRAAVQLLILTGARRAEVCGMRIEELDLEAGEWHLPAERTKTSAARTVYLSPLAVEIIRERIRERESGPVLVPPGKEGVELNPDTLTIAVRRLRESKLADLPEFTVHDLRRSCATGWAEYLDAEPHLIGLALGHARRDLMARTYQHDARADKQRRLLNAWGELVADHVTRDPGAEVVPLRRHVSA